MKTGYDIAAEACKQQDTKEMTRKAIKTLKTLGGFAEDLEEEFLAAYGEPAV